MDYSLQDIALSDSVACDPSNASYARESHSQCALSGAVWLTYRAASSTTLCRRQVLLFLEVGCAHPGEGKGFHAQLREDGAARLRNRHQAGVHPSPRTQQLVLLTPTQPQAVLQRHAKMSCMQALKCAMVRPHSTTHTAGVRWAAACSTWVISMRNIVKCQC